MSSKVTVSVEQAKNAKNIKVVSVAGQIDESNLPSVKKKIDPLIDSKTVRAVIIEASGLEFINSRVIGYFLSLYSEMNEKNKIVALLNANENILEILSLVGLTTLIEHYDSMDEALEALEAEEDTKEKK